TDLAGLGERLVQEQVALAVSLLRLEVIRRLEQHGIDLALLDELEDLDRLRLLGMRVLELLVGEDHVLVGLVLVAADDLLPRNLATRLLVVALVAHRREILAIEEREAQLVGRDRGTKRDRDLDQAEAQRATPECARRHGSLLSEWLVACKTSCRRRDGQDRGRERWHPRRNWLGEQSF